MVNFVFSPEWFYGLDSLFDTISIITCLFIALYAHRIYKMARQKKYKMFFYSFLLIGMSFLFKIGTNITIYFQLARTPLLLPIATVIKVGRLYYGGYLLYKLTFLVGIVFLLILSLKTNKRRLNLLLLFFCLVTAHFSHWAFYQFHLVAAAFLFVVVLFFRDNYLKTKSPNALQVAASFTLIMLSQVVFIFMFLTPWLYVTGELLQLGGYIMLLLSCVLVLRK